MLKRVGRWLSDRFSLGVIHKKVLHRRVPKPAWFLGDGAALVTLLATLVVTGSFMTLSYSPSIENAYDSVIYITEVQVFGRFVRALHYWSAGLMTVFLALHVFRQILLGGYKTPREGTWIIGVFLLGCVVIMSFTGYILRWDERSVYAIKVALHMFQRIPLIGDALVVLVQGGRDIGSLTLTRFFSIHTILVPLLLYVFTAIHLYLIIQKGIISKRERQLNVKTADEQRQVYKEEAESESEGELFYPDTAVKWSIHSFLCLVLVVSLAVIFGPGDLYPKANLTEVSFPQEEWWFYWYSALIALLPSQVAPTFFVMFPLVVFLVLLALPFVDRGANRGARRRPIAVACILFILGSLLYLTDLRRRSPWTGWPTDELPALPADLALTESAVKGRIFYSEFGCTSCHAISGQGRQVGPDLAALETPLSKEELIDYISRPPEGVAMPAYVDRMTKIQLDQVAEFVLVIQTSARGELR